MTSTENSPRVSTIRGLIDLKAEEFQDKTFSYLPGYWRFTDVC
jgi:hypothetical protein